MRARDAAARGAAFLRTARPLPLLALLCGAQVAVGLWYALATPHNGWLWYSGGDATEYWTEQWSMSHLLLPQTIVGWGLPVLYSWVPLVTGTTLPQGLPLIVVLQLGVLVPLVVVLVWALADRLYGRLFAWWAAFLWVVLPLLMLLALRPDYRVRFEENFAAPHLYGLTNMADLPSTAALLACGWATVRALDGDAPLDFVFAGLLGGLMLGIKPSTAFFLPAVAVLFVAARRARPAVLFGAGLLPSLVVLAVWKYRGLGYLPAISLGASREAAGVVVAVANPSRYVPFDLHHLNHELRALREYIWSLRFLEYLAIAGTIGAIRRGRRQGIFLLVWFAAYFFLKGSSELASIYSTSFFRLLEPSLPAFVLIAASVVFLAPRLAPEPRTAASRPIPRWALGATVAVTAVVPLVVVLAARLPSHERFARSALSTEMPISGRLTATATKEGPRVRLSWSKLTGGGTRFHYVVLRALGDTDGCDAPPQGADECLLYVSRIATTRRTTLLVSPNATYRIAAAANYRDHKTGGDLMLLGPPVRV